MMSSFINVPCHLAWINIEDSYHVSVEGKEDSNKRCLLNCRKALKVWKNNPNISILGSTTVRRLPIFSFIVYHPESGKLLHHNFVSVLLNDLYGIQARGGCACAGPYAWVSLKLGGWVYSEKPVLGWIKYVICMYVCMYGLILRFPALCLGWILSCMLNRS